MANEITMVCKLSVTKGGSTVTGDVTKQITLAGNGKLAATQVVGTSAELVEFPTDLTTEGVGQVWLLNTDPTNYIELALDSGMTNKFMKLKPGEPCLFRPASGSPTIYARANTAACNLQVVASGT